MQKTYSTGFFFMVVASCLHIKGSFLRLTYLFKKRREIYTYGFEHGELTDRRKYRGLTVTMSRLIE